MFTHEMIAEADTNGKTYQSKYGTYSKKDGFCLISFIKDYLNNMLHEDCWELKPAKKMTKEEIEEALGYEIEIIEYVQVVPIEKEPAMTVKGVQLSPLEQQAFNQIVKTLGGKNGCN